MKRDMKFKALIKDKDVVRVGIYRVILCNFVALEVVNDFCDELIKSSLYRHNIKRMCNALLNKIKQYNSKTYIIIGRNNCCFIVDAFNILYKEIELDILRLKSSFLLELNKKFVSNSNLISSLETARVLSGMCTLVMRKNIEIIKYIDLKNDCNIGFDGSCFEDFDLNDIFVTLDRICDEIYIDHNKSVDFNKSENCKNGMRVIDKKLSNHELLSKVLERAKSLSGSD